MSSEKALSFSDDLRYLLYFFFTSPAQNISFILSHRHLPLLALMAFEQERSLIVSHLLDGVLSFHIFCDIRSHPSDLPLSWLVRFGSVEIRISTGLTGLTFFLRRDG